MVAGTRFRRFYLQTRYVIGPSQHQETRAEMRFGDVYVSSYREYSYEAVLRTALVYISGGVAMAYSRTIVGNPGDGFTSTELEDGSGELAGRVFELEEGWYVECPNLDLLEDPSTC